MDEIPNHVKRWLLPAGIVGVILVAVTLVWFQPQKLFLDTTVDEDAPSAVPSASTSTSAPETTARPLAGMFSSLAHTTTGRAVVNEGASTLRLEDFRTENGPDLRVYLSSGEPYGKDFVDLGALKGNIGNQNYEIPEGTDLARYDTAVIWCRRFTVGFGAAQLR